MDVLFTWTGEDMGECCLEASMLRSAGREEREGWLWTAPGTIRWAPIQVLCWSDTAYFLTLKWKCTLGWLGLGPW